MHGHGRDHRLDGGIQFRETEELVVTQPVSPIGIKEPGMIGVMEPVLGS